MTIEEIKNFRQYGSKTAGHPEYGMAPGIETTTGPLGQGLGAAVGMAMAEKILAEEFGSDVVDHRTYAFCGDGCLMEGVGQEAVSLAGHLKLGKLTVLYDDNSISIDGATSLAFSDDIPAKFRALGWHVVTCNGLVPDEVDKALEEAKAEDRRPTLIDMKTIIGYGAPKKQGTEKAHGSALGAEEIAAARKALGWTSEPFVIPDELLERWRAIGRKGADARRAWEERLGKLAAERRAEFDRRIEGRLPADFDRVVKADPRQADRQSREARHPQVEPERARSADGCRARDDRRLGRPHRLEQHRHQIRPSPPSRPIIRAATSITACANSPWRPP